MSTAGTVTISLDFELAWGMCERPAAVDAVMSEDRRTESEYLDRLLELCDRLRIPVTFATVGHLFLEGCDGAHPDVGAGDGLAADPATDRRTDPLYYAPDLVDRIRAATTDHEIATHTFSHVRCDRVPASTVASELAAAADRHEERGLEPPRTLVAPRNRLPDYDVLRESGIETVRVPRPRPAASDVGRHLRRLREWTVDRTVPVGTPTVREGIVEQYSTPFPSLTAVHLPTGRADPLAPFRTVPTRLRQRRHEAYLLGALETAREAGAHAHFWTHVYNFANESQWAPIESLLRAVAAFRERGEIQVRTMGEVAESVAAERDAPPAP